MTLTHYPALGHLALQNSCALTAAGTDLHLLLADTALYQPNILQSERLFSQVRAPEPIPALESPVIEIDAETIEDRCAQLLNQFLQAHPALVNQTTEHTVLLCPLRAKPLLAQNRLPESFGEIHWVHQLEDALQCLQQLAEENRQQGIRINWLSIDSLLDYATYKDYNGNLATDRNPEGLIPGEAACCLCFNVAAEVQGCVQTVLEPMAAQAETELTEALDTLFGENPPAELISNRSTNSNPQLAEWYRTLGLPAAGLAQLSTRQTLGDSGLVETALVLTLAFAKARYEDKALSPCLVFNGLQRLYWQLDLSADTLNNQRNEQ